MKTTQQLEELEEKDEIVFLESSESVLVGFTTDKSTLLQIVKSAECLKNSEATFTIYDEGLSFRAMDKDHVALVDMGIPNSCFEKWSCLEKQSFDLDIKEFRQMINALDNKGSISLEIQSEKILVSQNGFKATIKIKDSIESDCPLPRIPQDATMIFSEEQTTNALDFARITKKIATVSDYVTINCNNKRVQFSGTGDKGSCEKFVTSEECEIKTREDVDTTYSLEYLIPFLRTLRKDSQIELGFSDEKPLRIQTRINNLGRVDFYLAPRVAN